jgi:hypothetical protein
VFWPAPIPHIRWPLRCRRWRADVVWT